MNMALGGGTFITQNKVLAGAYINFISTATASAAVGERGYAAMGLDLDWGQEGKIVTVTNGDFQKNSMTIFGYDFANDKLKGLRDLFQNIKVLHFYRLTSGGVKASNNYATAKYCGVRGNDLKIVIQTNVDDGEKFDVATYLDTNLVDLQTVASSSDLVANDFVDWKEFDIDVTAGAALSNGTNGTVNAAAHQAFLDKIESYPSINAIGYVGNDAAVKNLYVAFVKRMRDEVGVKFQCVMQDKDADYEGVVNLLNSTVDSTSDLVYWVTGVIAGTAINASATNKKYSGEFDVNTDYTQMELEDAVQSGKFVLHQVGENVRVLDDINSLVTVTDTKGDVFKDNQTIRIIDEIATSIASVFVDKYLGVVPNDASGRISLWNDIVKHHMQMQDIRAIEDFDEADVTVEQGNSKKSVVVNDAIQVVNTMTKLYMTVQIG